MRDSYELEVLSKISINLYIDIDYNICYHIIVVNDEYINWKRGMVMKIKIVRRCPICDNITHMEIENWNVENSKYSNACERTFCKDGICRNCQYKIYSKEARTNWILKYYGLIKTMC